MHLRRVVLCIVLGFAVAVLGCTKEKATETPQQDYVSKNLVPSKAEAKGESLTAELSGLQVSMMVNTASKEIVQTPSLRGRYKITNTSKDLLEVQGVTIEYMDEGGAPIAFATGEKIAKASLFLNAIKPGESAEGSLDVTMPRAAVKTLAKININVVYIPSPLKRETLTMPEKME